ALLVQHLRVDLAAEVGEGLEPALRGPGLSDRMHDAGADVADRREPVADPSDRFRSGGPLALRFIVRAAWAELSPGTPRGREVQLALVHVRRQDLDPHEPAGVQV